MNSGDSESSIFNPGGNTRNPSIHTGKIAAAIGGLFIAATLILADSRRNLPTSIQPNAI